VLSNITVVKNTKGNLNKHIAVDGSKTSTASMSTGTYRTQSLNHLDDLLHCIKSLESNEAIVLGTADDSEGNITSNPNDDNAITRTKKNFKWDKHTQILLFDYDYADGIKKINSLKEYRDLLITIDSSFKDAQMLIIPSSSSGIYNSNNEVVLDSSGLHCYVVVSHTENIKTWIYNLFNKCWKLGLGVIKFSKDGKQLQRTIFDKSVFSPERLVFEAEPTLDKGLHRKVVEPLLIDGGVIDLSNITPTLQPKEVSDKLIETIAESKKIKKHYINTEIDRLVSKGFTEIIATEFVTSRCEDALIKLDDLIVFKDGTVKLARDITVNDSGKYCLDPIEPTEAPAVVNVYDDGSVMIYSFLHGGRHFYIEEEYKQPFLENSLGFDEDRFIDTFVNKWENNFNNVSSDALKQTWRYNFQAMCKVIEDNKNNRSIKYVVSAVTGSAKTESIKTFCTLLDDTKALISTNLTSEADKIASDINEEAGNDIAIAFHSKTNIKIDKASKYKIVVVSHEFYRRNYTGTTKWDLLTCDRDLIIIDEALDTLVEISVNAAAIKRAITVVEALTTWSKYKDNVYVIGALGSLKKSLNELTLGRKLLGKGNILTHGENDDAFEGTEITDTVDFKNFVITMYDPLIEILKLDSKISVSQILIGTKDASKDDKLKQRIITTLQSLQMMFDEQLYISSHQGFDSYNMVIDSTPNKSIVCFDATSSVSETYKLRQEHHKDLLLIPKVQNVRNYETVNIYTAKTNTGSSRYEKAEDVEALLSSVQFGQKTLVVTHKANKAVFLQLAKTKYPDKIIEVAHWGALTGLNDWDDFDTCVLAGILHKPQFYNQNRAITNASEDIAFGEHQTDITNQIKITDECADIVQAINRIRIRKPIDNKGRCLPANIFVTLPLYNYALYQKIISKEMPKSNFYDWHISESLTPNEYNEGYLPAILEWLDSNVKDDDVVSIYEPRNALSIQTKSYSKIISKKSFIEQLDVFGFKITSEYKTDKYGRKNKRPSKYISRI